MPTRRGAAAWCGGGCGAGRSWWVMGLLGRSRGGPAQERNSREYWVSCWADRMASMGRKAWRGCRRGAPARVDGGGNLARPAAPGCAGRRSGPAARLERGLHHVLGPAEGVGQQRCRARWRAGARCGQRKGHRVGGVEGSAARWRTGGHQGVAGCWLRSQSASERPICSVCRRSSLVSRVCSTQSLSVRTCARSPAPGATAWPARAGRRAPGSGAAGPAASRTLRFSSNK
jgi:hypothetical protein